jgi:hypothetical protein
MVIPFYERLSATQAFYRLLNRIIADGSAYRAGGNVETLKLLNAHTLIDMSNPLVGMETVNYSALAKETMQLLNQFFDGEPRVLKSLLEGQTEVHYWRQNKLFSLKITFLIRGRWMHLAAHYSTCDLWYHFTPDVLELSLLAAKICLIYYQHTNIKLHLGRLDLNIGRCFVRLDEVNTIKTCLEQAPLDTSPLILETYYQAPLGEAWESLVQDLKEGEARIHKDKLWNIGGDR